MNTKFRQLMGRTRLLSRGAQRTLIYGAGAAGVMLLRESRSNLAAVVAKHDIHQVLIALPSASGAEMTRVSRLCQEARVRFRTAPSLVEIVEGPALASQIREVAVEDLLGRTPLHLEERQIRGTIEGKVVMVTGAAGIVGAMAAAG